ncbi:MAG TPA: 3'-5' exonuclease [Lachnospiraceae bacterium]|nr:3'-5' exonuclease [Lachnospiraceae bacterium]
MTRNKGKRLNAYVKDYVVFDLETTGINLNQDEIIEISGIKVRDSKVVEKFSTLVNPCMPIPRFATAVNGITDKMVKDAPLLMNALGNFLDFAGQDILVGHNIHTFDTNFIYDGAVRELGRPVQNDYVDTLYMAKRALPQLDHHRLVDVASYFHVETEGAHRALFDCEMNQQCYEKIGLIWIEKEKQQASDNPSCRHTKKALRPMDL